MPRFTLAAVLAVTLFAAAPGAGAQETPAAPAAPAELAAFNTACLGAQQFLLGEVPAGVDAASILTPLCGCLGTALKDLPQKDVDVLAADLRGEGTKEAHEAHGSYQQVEDKARDGLNACFSSPEVSAALAAAQPAPAAPASPAVPATPAAPATPAEPAPAPAQ
jgi:hypothetical protein